MGIMLPRLACLHALLFVAATITLNCNYCDAVPENLAEDEWVSTKTGTASMPASSQTTTLQVFFQKLILPEAAPAFQQNIAAQAVDIDPLAGYAAAPAELENEYEAKTTVSATSRDGPIVDLRLVLYMDSHEFNRDPQVQARILDDIVAHFQMKRSQVQLRAVDGPQQPDGAPKVALQ